MKNILIIGATKSGKSTLANRIASKSKYHKIPLDYFTSSFKHTFGELGISSNVVIEEKTSQKLSLFLSHIIPMMEQDGENYIIDSAHLYLKDIIPYIDESKWTILCLGYPNISPEEKLKQIREHETKQDWTYKNSDDELFVKLEKLIAISKKLEVQCRDYKIPFIDTSNHMMEKIKDTAQEWEK